MCMQISLIPCKSLKRFTYSTAYNKMFSIIICIFAAWYANTRPGICMCIYFKFQPPTCHTYVWLFDMIEYWMKEPSFSPLCSKCSGFKNFPRGRSSKSFLWAFATKRRGRRKRQQPRDRGRCEADSLSLLDFTWALKSLELWMLS